MKSVIGRNFKMVILFSMTVIFLSNCHHNAGFFSGNQLKVTATTTLVADMVRQIGGDRVEVLSLMGPGIDPHMYKASENDIIRIMESDLVFYSGLHLEGKLEMVFEKMSRSHIRTYAVSEGISRDILLQVDKNTGHYDPHFWFSVEAWQQASVCVQQVLSRVDTSNALVYEKNLKDYLVQLDSLETWVHREIAKINPEQRVLITAHDAFNYFGKYYGFEVMGLQGLNTAAEAGVKDVIDLAGLIATRKIKSVFTETSVPPRNVEALKEAVKSRGFNVNSGGSLYSDSLGDENSEAGTYIEMYKYNVQVIVDALK